MPAAVIFGIISVFSFGIRQLYPKKQVEVGS